MNTKSLFTRSVIIFAALAVAGLIVAGSASVVPEGLQQTIMVAIGSAMFGASLSFFLVRILSVLEK